MRRLKNSFAALLALVMTIACFSTVVNADGDLVESGTVEGKFDYVLYSDGLLEIKANYELLDITDSFNWDKLGYVTSIKVDFSRFHNTLCYIGCTSEYCNISSFEILIHPKFHESTETICNINGFPKFTGAENSLVLSETNGTHLRINNSNITSLDFLKGYNLQGFQLTDCDQLESAVVSGDYNYVIFDNCDKLSKLDLRGCTKLSSFRAMSNPELAEFYLPDIQTISTLPYMGCANNPKLKAFTIPSSVKVLDSYAFSKAGLVDIKIPEGVEVIEDFVFGDCKELKTVYLPSTLNHLAYYSFLSCRLETVYYNGTKEQFEAIGVFDSGEESDVSIYDLFGEAEIRFEPIIGWVKTGNDWIYFIEPGVKVAGWQEIDDAWYFFDSKGVMQTGWKQYNGSWYYLDPGTGAMATGWKKVNGNWYFFDNNSGVMCSNIALAENDKVYVLTSSGTLASGWYKIGQTWYYCGSDGVAAEGWKKIDGKWYFFFREIGAMASNCWVKDNGKWYFFDANGNMVTGWKQLGEYWYYFKSSGEMAANEYCKGYWLDADGKWTYQYVAKWTKNSTGWWYGDTAGWYAKNCSLTIDGKVYNFNASGYCTNP